jgi:hypothetical protein
MKRRPLAVVLVAGLYLLIGILGFGYHFNELLSRAPDAIAIELTEVVGAVAGVGLLLRQNWARWLALAWVVFHVGVSLFHPLGELLIHSALCGVVAWALLRPATGRWFQRVVEI